jgi:hypothetical protein
VDIDESDDTLSEEADLTEVALIANIAI